MPATKVFEDDDEFSEGDRWEALAWAVPESDEFPNGVKYSFQYPGPADEEILRYDNANDAHGVGRHHRHYRGEVEGVRFEGLRSHIRKFLDEVETIHEQEFARPRPRTSGGCPVPFDAPHHVEAIRGS